MLITSRPADHGVNEPIRVVIRRDPFDSNAASYSYEVRDATGGVPTKGLLADLGTDGTEEVVIPGIGNAGSYDLVVISTDPTTGVPRDVITYPFAVGGPSVTRVQLVNVDALRSDIGIGTPCSSYPGYVAWLQDNITGRRLAGVAVPGFSGQRTPDFCIANLTYELLISEAKDYVRSCTCTSADELYPDGYIQGRRDAEPLLDTGVPNADLPCVELIWNYWQEEGMLAQTMNHIVARFQNRRASSGDPLARFDVTPLLPLRSLLWGWVENEQRRLTVRRRAAEYEYEYGLSLIGRAVPSPDTLVERRAGFLRAFHTTLHQATLFFKQLDDLTITPDGFPLYEALRDCHLVLSQGAQNQYGEMAMTARAEMLVMQHILAQPPMREFLGGRPMTPYPEVWMDRVDSMKSIQGWSDASVMHFHDLATFGERLVLTIRLGNWAGQNVSAPQAATWASGFRPIIQRYIAAYRAVTGIDLSTRPDTTMPSTLIARRVGETRSRA